MNFRARVASLRGRVLDGHGTAYVSSTIARPILEHPTTSYRLFSRICPSLARPEAPFTGLGKWSRTLSWTIVGALLSPYTMPKRKRARGDHGRPAPTEEPSAKGPSSTLLALIVLVDVKSAPLSELSPHQGNTNRPKDPIHFWECGSRRVDLCCSFFEWWSTAIRCRRQRQIYSVRKKSISKSSSTNQRASSHTFRKV